MIQGVLTVHAIEANDVVLLDGQPPETVLGCYLRLCTRSFMKRTRAFPSRDRFPECSCVPPPEADLVTCRVGAA